MKELFVRVAGQASDAAKQILHADLAQVLMILTTLVAGVTYGWVEGYVIRENLTDRPFTSFGHFSSYQIAIGILFALITGGFALLKAQNMFAKGQRFFLFAVVGNYPFAWLVEDFAYFLFNPLDTLRAGHWSNWFLGGVYVYSPWLPGNPKPELWIPAWYFLAFAWFVGANWYAHQSTVYDNLVKDQIAREIVPRKIELPPGPSPERIAVPEAEKPTVPRELTRVEPERPKRTVEAQEALEKLRARVLKDA